MFTLNTRIPEKIQKGVHSLYNTDLARAPKEYLDSFFENIKTKIATGKFLSRQERKIGYYFLFKLIAENKSNHLSLYKKFLYESLSNVELELLARGYFEFCYSNEAKFDSQTIQKVKALIRNGETTFFLSPLLEPKSIVNLRIDDNLKFSEEIAKIGRGLISTSSQFALIFWDREEDRVVSKTLHILRKEGIPEVQKYLLDFFCCSTSPLELRKSNANRRISALLNKVEDQLTNTEFFFSSQDLAHLSDLYLSIGSMVSYSTKLNRKEPENYVVGEVFDVILNRMKKIKSWQRLSLARVIKMLLSGEKLTIFLYAKNVKQFDHLSSITFNEKFCFRLFPLDSKYKETVIAFFKGGNVELIFYPETGFVGVKGASLFNRQDLFPDKIFNTCDQIDLNEKYWEQVILSKYTQSYIKTVTGSITQSLFGLFRRKLS